MQMPARLWATITQKPAHKVALCIPCIHTRDFLHLITKGRGPGAGGRGPGAGGRGPGAGGRGPGAGGRGPGAGGRAVFTPLVTGTPGGGGKVWGGDRG